MKNLIVCLYYFCTFIFVGCISSGQRKSKAPIARQASMQLKLDSVTGFDDLANRQLEFQSMYQKMIDSLELSVADTVGFFIRPCFTHRGVLFKISGSRCVEYYYKFSTFYHEIKPIDDACNVSNAFFSFACDSLLMKKIHNKDSVVVIPDCPVIIFTKLKGDFYYRKINGEELNYFTEKSAEFRMLLKESFQ